MQILLLLVSCLTLKIYKLQIRIQISVWVLASLTTVNQFFAPEISVSRRRAPCVGRLIRHMTGNPMKREHTERNEMAEHGTVL